MRQLRYAQDRANASWHLMIDENRRLHDSAMAEFSASVEWQRKRRSLAWAGLLMLSTAIVGAILGVMYG